MLFKRNDQIITESVMYFDSNVDENKYITVWTKENGQVEFVKLFDMNKDNTLVGVYRCKKILYPAAFTVKDDQYLSTDLLTSFEDFFEVEYEA